MKKKLHGMKKIDNSWQHCCRWCHHFSNGKCMCPDIEGGEYVDVTYISENGYVAEVLKESIGSVDRKDFKELEYLLREWKVSEKRIKEFKDTFEKCFEEWQQEAVEQIDEDVTKCFNKHLEEDFNYEVGVEILDPREHCCSRWC